MAHTCLLHVVCINMRVHPDWASYSICSVKLCAFFVPLYRASHVLVGWVLLTWISSVPLSARLCLVWWKFARRRWAAGQDCGTLWLWFLCSTILPLAKFLIAQAELGRQWNTRNPSKQNPVSAHLEHPVEYFIFMCKTLLGHHVFF